MSLDRYQRDLERRKKVLREQGLVPAPPLFGKEEVVPGTPTWKFQKPFQATDSAVTPPGRSLREIQAAFRDVDLNDMKPHEWPRKSESEFEFNLKESESSRSKRSIMKGAPSPTRPEFNTLKTFEQPVDLNEDSPTRPTNRIPSAADRDWNQVPMGLYFETMMHLVDRTLTSSEIRTALHSKPTENGQPANKCEVPQAIIDAHLAGESEAIAHRFSAQIAGSIVQRLERMIARGRHSRTEASHPDCMPLRPRLKTLKDISGEMLSYLERSKEQRVEAGESPWHVTHELTWAAWVHKAVEDGVWHLAGEREGCGCLGVAVYEID